MIHVNPHKESAIFRRSLLFAVSFTVLLWIVRAVEWGTDADFGVWGILPRTLSGMTGIVTAPLIHGTFVHLLSNTFPLIFLMIAVFYFYEKIALEVFVWIYLVTGFWVWVAARQAYHIGASGLVYGLATFLFFSGLFRRDIRSVTVATAIGFLYSGMVQGIFPTAENISWESHLLGAGAGILCAFYFRGSKKPHLVNINTRDEANSSFITTSTFQEYHFTESTSYTYVVKKNGGEKGESVTKQNNQNI